MQILLFENTTKIFNQVNEVNEDKKHWEILIGPWFNYFLVSYLYKYFFFNYLIKNKINLFNNEYENFLSFKPFVDHNDFMYNTNDLNWNDVFINIFF